MSFDPLNPFPPSLLIPRPNCAVCAKSLISAGERTIFRSRFVSSPAIANRVIRGSRLTFTLAGVFFVEILLGLLPGWKVLKTGVVELLRLVKLILS